MLPHKKLRSIIGRSFFNASWRLPRPLPRQLLVFAVVLGRGRRVFREGSRPTNFVLATTRRTRPGVRILAYRPAA